MNDLAEINALSRGIRTLITASQNDNKLVNSAIVIPAQINALASTVRLFTGADDTAHELILDDLYDVMHKWGLCK